MRNLFIIGNKRSGTSQLVRLLNLHPEVFVSHESDIAWILYQYHLDLPFQVHPWDSGRGMHYTLRSHGHRLKRDRSPRENLETMLTALMEGGSPWLDHQQKRGLKWIGDKHPFQHTDDRLFEFILGNFAEPRFLHIVRHPYAVATSSERFNKSRDGDFWQGLTPGQKLDRWAFHEAQVLKFKESGKARIHTLRYEDLCRNTEHELKRVFQFLDLGAEPWLFREAARQTAPAFRPYPKIGASANILKIAGLYRYGLKKPMRAPQALGEVLYWRALKKLNHVLRAGRRSKRA